jgi:hypothetical protein
MTTLFREPQDFETGQDLRYPHYILRSGDIRVTLNAMTAAEIDIIHPKNNRRATESPGLYLIYMITRDFGTRTPPPMGHVSREEVEEHLPKTFRHLESEQPNNP